ncbi:hypothetical protein KI387_006459 [Taxus chinensis]|uniref:non-specific serine/threonine protein kinase n=1 Tax=Taxus chinensis TaxID=29808 RepID=A0AA38GNW8_TAXCH|nr:hypothetical protein KI387_006459 [Taxus chinensis]
MSNGILNDVLHEMISPTVLGWDTRFKIAIGTAHGLSYLHNDCTPRIIHRDIKPGNILLDSEMEPHISDFGIVQLTDRSLTVDSCSSLVMGTLGYIAPERAHTARMRKKMDVYSYGVVLLELITRKKALDSSFSEGIDIVSWVKSCNEGEDVVIDEGLGDDATEPAIKKEILGMIRITRKCTEANPEDRPSMR